MPMQQNVAKLCKNATKRGTFESNTNIGKLQIIDYQRIVVQGVPTEPNAQSTVQVNIQPVQGADGYIPVLIFGGWLNISANELRGTTLIVGFANVGNVTHSGYCVVGIFAYKIIN